MDILTYITLTYMLVSAIIQFMIIKRKKKSKPLKTVFICIGIVIEAVLVYKYVLDPQIITLCFIMMCAVDILSWFDFYIDKMIKNSKK